MNKTNLLFLIILIEGYVVLAVELLAIRTLIPFVGSGTEVISIIISAVLLPLAFGYHFGGKAFGLEYKKAKSEFGEIPSIRRMLRRNIIISASILALGLSYIFQEGFFTSIEGMSAGNRIVKTAIYCLLFIAPPVFLLGQTVPLISNYFSRVKLSEITGKMLFFSTTGSFLGSVFSTIVLMAYVGVHNTIIITISLLCLLWFFLSKSVINRGALFCLGIVFMVYALNNDTVTRLMGTVSNNSYNMVKVGYLGDDLKVFSVNRSYSSVVSKDGKNKADNIAYIDDNFINPTLKDGIAPIDILVIGSGGFAVGLEDSKNNYTFVDIDPDLKEVAEKYFLEKKLTPNKKFVAASARAFVHGHDKKYDLVFIDVYSNFMSIPMECVTREFLLDTKQLLKESGVLVVNVVANPMFGDKFSVRYNNTFASVFPVFSRQIIRPIHDDNSWTTYRNILYIYHNNPLVNDNTVYTDDKNTYSVDR